MTITQSTGLRACCFAGKHHRCRGGRRTTTATTTTNGRPPPLKGPARLNLCTRQSNQPRNNKITTNESFHETRSLGSSTSIASSRLISEPMQTKSIDSLLNKQQNPSSQANIRRTANLLTKLFLVAIAFCCLFSLSSVKLCTANHHLLNVAQPQLQQPSPYPIQQQPMRHNQNRLESNQIHPFDHANHRTSQQQQQQQQQKQKQQQQRQLLLQLSQVLSQQRQQQLANSLSRPHQDESPALHYSNWNHHHYQQQQQQSEPQQAQNGHYWTTSSANPGDSLLASGQVQETNPMQPATSDQHIAYQASSVTAASTNHHQAPIQQTTPSLNKQLVAPPPFYELSLAPTNTIQLESSPSQEEPMQQPYEPLTHHHHHQLATSESIQHPVVVAAPGTSGSSSSSDTNMTSHHQQQQPPQAAGLQTMSARQARQQNDMSNESTPDNKEVDQSGPSHQADQPVDKSIEPRHRRRLFNRILKKVDWNTVLVELSRVLLKTILDSALKDIIGKQSGGLGSGATGGGSGTGGDSTSSRKKLDAQSELADLLRDFITKAISSTFSQ